MKREESSCIDLNCDMGEIALAIADGTQEALMRSVTSVNVACGGHAGDEQMMKATVEQAMRAGVAIGAHPGYPDRKNFGRLEMKMPADRIADSVCEQILALAKVAEECGARIVHVKPHGALYNQAAHSRKIALAIVEGVAGAENMARALKIGNHALRGDAVLIGLAGSPMLEVFRERGFAVAAEAFADRKYEPDGTLRSRKFEDALIRDAEEAGRQALSIVERGVVLASGGSEVSVLAQTICIHGDTPRAVKIAEAVVRALARAGVHVQILQKDSLSQQRKL